MEGLDRLAARGDVGKGPVQLGQVFRIQGDVELGQLCGPEAELAARDAPAGDQFLILQIAELALDPVGEVRVLHAVLQIAPDVIDVHRLIPKVVDNDPCDRVALPAR